MTGRVLFRKARPILVGLAAGLSIFPQGVRNWFWIIANLFPGGVGYGLRYSLARASKAQLGDNVLFGHNTTIKSWQNLKIGNNVSIHENCFIDALGGIEIGDDVSIAHGCSLISFDHSPAPDAPLKYGPLVPGSIVIDDDVWVSAGVRILRDTRIGSRTIIAANAVVRGQVAGGAIYGGVPARSLKSVAKKTGDYRSEPISDLSNASSSGEGF